MTHRLLAVLAVLSLGTGAALAQESLSKERPKPAPKKASVLVSKRVMSVGAHASYGIMMNGVSAFKLPSVPSCCPGYESTSGSGLVFGAEIALPMSETIDIGGRLVYQSSATDFTAAEPITVRAGNGVLKTNINHSFKTSTSFLMIEPVASIKLGGGLAMMAGLRVGTTLGGTYDQQESLADPSIPYDFSSGSGLYNVKNGDIPNTSGLQAGVLVGVRYAVALSGGLSLMPEVTYSPMFTDVVTDASWTISPLRIGVGILFDVMSTETASTPIAP
ncbi:MAG: hypothetical protein ACKOE4_03035 [Candidatus Kapaibacterium sp.]